MLEPIWPRPPPSSARTISRRRWSERASSGAWDRSAPKGRSSGKGETAVMVGQRPQEGGGFGELPGLRRGAVTGPGEFTASPAFRQEFVEQDQAPAQTIERIEQVQA